MTLKELSKLYYLKKLIDRDELRLLELKSKLGPGAMQITGMPRGGGGAKNKIEEVVPLAIEIEQKITEERNQYIAEQRRIEEYLNSIDDYQIRLIMLHRFVDLLRWEQIAAKIGGNNTSDSVKKACYRYIKKGTV